MNASELAEKMLLWEKTKHELDNLATEIEAEVLTLKKTQVVGGVRVTYSGGRSTYDYETPCENAPDEIIEKYISTREVVDWSGVAGEVPDVVDKYTSIEATVDYKAVCKEAGINPLVLSTTPTTAKIKLEE